MTTNLNPVDFGASLNAISNSGSANAQGALKVKAKAKQAAENFESMFLSNMFQQMYTSVDGDGPFGGSGALKIWRSFMTDQIAKSFAQAGGIGLAPQVYESLLKHQGLSA
jgi:Rod binding domain-containing protein